MAYADAAMTMNVPLVRELLDELGWTWADLAAAMEMSKSTVSRVQSGDKRPGREFIFALQRVFPEHKDQLFVRDRAMQPRVPTPADDDDAA